MKSPVIYQIFLRTFTQEGTLAAAEKYLPQVAQTGADTVYLTPLAYADRSTDKKYWSPRHIASGFDNPCSPYRVGDFREIDPEYGTWSALRSFICAAHDCGLKVIFDLVYYHAGPTFAQTHPDWVDTNGEYCYPRLDFSSPHLREYLTENMFQYVAAGADGFRCDVGDSVPLDFWQSAVAACRTVKADLYMLCEGETRAAEDQESGIFDSNYSFSWSYALYDVFTGKEPARILTEIHRKNGPYCFVRAVENHDIAHDTSQKKARLETVIGRDGMDAVLFLNYMVDGVPFLYNGVEICDTAPHNIFAFSGACVIDRRNGKEPRSGFLRQLALLRESLSGKTEFFRTDGIIAFKRGEGHIAVINCTDHIQKMPAPDGEWLCSRNAAMKNNILTLSPYGFLLIRKTV